MIEKIPRQRSFFNQYMFEAPGDDDKTTVSEEQRPRRIGGRPTTNRGNTDYGVDNDSDTDDTPTAQTANNAAGDEDGPTDYGAEDDTPNDTDDTADDQTPAADDNNDSGDDASDDDTATDYGADDGDDSNDDTADDGGASDSGDEGDTGDDSDGPTDYGSEEFFTEHARKGSLLSR